MKYLYFESQADIKQKVTIFSIPKPFVGHIGTIQRNAIISWSLLNPQPEIILFGDEVGTKEIAAELDLLHVSEIKRNQYGTPLLKTVFTEVEQRASHDLLVYLNADIILMDDFLTSITAVAEQLDKFLVIGRRWNVDFDHRLEFDLHWSKNLRQLVVTQGCLACYQCKDYFVFPKHLFSNIPEFAVGRGYWDTWMVHQALESNYPVVDASLGAMVVHQNHDYDHIPGGKNEAYMGKEAENNKFLGNSKISGTIADATWQLKPSQTKNLPQVSIVITPSDDARQMEMTILSILSQKDSSYEIIAIDDGSDDKLQTILQPYQQQIGYISGQESGILAACNHSLKITQGEFIIFIPAGCLLLPGALKKQISGFEEEASTLDILLSGWQFISDRNSFHSLSIKANQPSLAIKNQPWKTVPNLENLHIWKLNEIWQPFHESVVMFRRSSLNSIGGFQTKLNYLAAIIEAIITLTFLKGSRAMWLEQSTAIISESFLHNFQTTINLTQEKQEVVNLFYQRREIKKWMRILQNEAHQAVAKERFLVNS
jgi:glycosyltransferase involved in cell wall biosynthesis